MDEERREGIWKEMVERSKRREEKVVLRVVKRDWKKRSFVKSGLKNLWMLVILEVIGCGLFVILELLK